MKMSDIESKMKADLALVSEESSGSEDKGEKFYILTFRNSNCLSSLYPKYEIF